MAHNFNRDKRRIEEGKKKKQEEKRLKKLQRAQGLAAAPQVPDEDAVPPATGLTNTEENQGF